MDNTRARALIYDVNTKFNRYEVRNKVYSTNILKFELYDDDHNICIKFAINLRHDNFKKIIDYIEKSLRYRQNAHNYIMQNLICFEQTTKNKYKNSYYRLHINDDHIFIKVDLLDSKIVTCQPEEIINHFPELVIKKFTSTKCAKF